MVGILCRDVRLNAISFTGSTEIGRLIAAQCASTLRRLLLEFGAARRSSFSRTLNVPSGCPAACEPSNFFLRV